MSALECDVLRDGTAIRFLETLRTFVADRATREPIEASAVEATDIGDDSHRADARFARPNIQIYDAHVVDLYQWVCARYLAGAYISGFFERLAERVSVNSH